MALLGPDGNLVIVDASKSVIWSSELSLEDKCTVERDAFYQQLHGSDGRPEGAVFPKT